MGIWRRRVINTCCGWRFTGRPRVLAASLIGLTVAAAAYQVSDYSLVAPASAVAAVETQALEPIATHRSAKMSGTSHRKSNTSRRKPKETPILPRPRLDQDSGMVLENATTTPLADDPEGGIPIDGSGGAHLHRGTGEHPPGTADLPNRNRPGMRAWVTRGREPGACQEIRQFQFGRTSVFLVNADGTETNFDDLAGKFSNGNKYGGGTQPRERFGHWEADDYRKDHPNDEKVPMPGETDAQGNPLTGGPYYGPGPNAGPGGSPIPGVNGAIGVVDAPQWARPPLAFDTYKEREKRRRLAPGEHRKTWPPHTGAQPPQEGPYTLRFQMDFRDYIYCTKPKPKRCLAYYNWHESETVTFNIVYVDTRSETDKIANDPPRWQATQQTTDYKYDGPHFDPLQQPCP